MGAYGGEQAEVLRPKTQSATGVHQFVGRLCKNAVTA